MFEYLLACCKKVALMYVWMDGWMDVWMDGWMDGCIPPLHGLLLSLGRCIIYVTAQRPAAL